MKGGDYPDAEQDIDFITRIYKKREYATKKMGYRETINSYFELKKLRNEICMGKRSAQLQQQFVAQYIHPSTPYKNILLFHGVGTGKTCAAIMIAENFKDQVLRYKTKIYVITSGPILKKEFFNELSTCNDAYKNLPPKQFSKAVKKYYRFWSYKKFVESTDKDDAELNIDLSNSVIIIDEAHNIVGNTRGDALIKVLKTNKNIRLILLTATPMRNLPQDIIPLINFMRINDGKKILKESKIFSGSSIDQEIKPESINAFQQASKGYISFLEGKNPYTFAIQRDMGILPDFLLFTRIVSCEMHTFQKKAYNMYLSSSEHDGDHLDRRSQSLSNFVFPGMEKNTAKIIPIFGENKLNSMKIQLEEALENTQNSNLLKNIKKTFKMDEPLDEIIHAKNETKTLTGAFLKKKYLKNFSAKFHKCLCNIDDLSEGTAFVYSSLVRVGVHQFVHVLLENGYLEYQESENYILGDDTLHYTGKIRYGKFKQKYNKKFIPKFIPATFISITGGGEEFNEIPDEKVRIIKKIFNNPANASGKHIKVLVGSRVVREGITFENVSQVHILDVHYHLGLNEQIIGRAIRHCKHITVTNKDNPYPEVKVFRYAVTLSGSKLSREEEMLKKSEIKYIQIKKVERILQEIAIDCPLNHAENQKPMILSKYKSCIPIEKKIENPKIKGITCPERCNFMQCDYKCKEDKLNELFYKNKKYITPKLDDIDMSTFNPIDEIILCSRLIKTLYLVHDALRMMTIIKKVKKMYPHNIKHLFDRELVFWSVTELMARVDNGLINQFNESGHLIYFNGMYYFRSFQKSAFDLSADNRVISAKSYLQNIEHVDFKSAESYVYDTYYYNKKKENIVIGILDKRITKKINRDIFKIRVAKQKNIVKRRAKNLPTDAGAECLTKNKKELLVLAKELGITKKMQRKNLCWQIQKTLRELEKYSVNNKTFYKVPINHPTEPFPLNIHDRIPYIEKTFQVKVKYRKESLDSKNKKIVGYHVSFPNTSSVDETVCKKYGLHVSHNKWIGMLM
uniref:Early transcription factor 70 kDa subunit n=1 Tax=Megaviridae environmental sample TaxID=1737588 RepID=A0A5J6VH05_9VIRU|nr:MAG: hypothetical protein [Megaviridae environmental sample]